MGRERRPLADDRAHRAGRLTGARHGELPEVDLKAAYGDVAEFEATVLPDSQHAELATRAVKTAILERGVSHLIFPDEIQTQSAEGVEPGDPEGRITDRDIAPPADALDDAVDLLETAKRPVIVVGHGARFEMDGIIELAERFDCPVLTTFKAKGQIPDSHPLAGEVLGRSGTPIASHFMNESDVVAVFGASFSNHARPAQRRRTREDQQGAAYGRLGCLADRPREPRIRRVRGELWRTRRLRRRPRRPRRGARNRDRPRWPRTR